MSLIKVLNKIIDRETAARGGEEIDGVNPRDAAQHVMLDLGYTPVVERYFGDMGHQIPEPVRVVKDGARYCLMFGRDYRWVSVEELKVMRARFLLLRGWYYRAFDGFSHPDKQKILAWYFKGGMWRP